MVRLVYLMKDGTLCSHQHIGIGRHRGKDAARFLVETGVPAAARRQCHDRNAQRDGSLAQALTLPFVARPFRPGGCDRRGSASDIPQVAFRLTSRSPDFARWASVFRPERCLSSRKRPKSGGSSLEPAAFWPGRAAFPRGRRTCPAAFVQLGHGSWSCA